MATVTFDGQSLMLDGRREWLVSATFWYSRSPAKDWPRALGALRDAGFNTVLLPIVWSHHEPVKGEFRFSGDHDLAACIRLAGSLNLKVILRTGPHVGGGEDLGGIPAWAGGVNNLGQPALWRGPDGGKPAVRPPTKTDFAATMAHVRSGSAAFLEDAARWFTALGEQIEDLQASSRVEGPIVLAQVEHEWFCEHDPSSEAYLTEVSRFARECGLSVPLANANNLHAWSEGDLDAWSGAENPLLTARQLRAVRPNQPPFLLEVAPPPELAWGDDPKHANPDGRALARTLAEACAGGAQFNLASLLGGNRPAFSAGAYDDRPAAYAITAADLGTLISSTGVPRDGLAQVKRVATFASYFGRVLAHADPTLTPISLAPEPSATSVVPLRGARGSAVFILLDDAAKKPPHLTLARPDGSTLPVPLPDQPVAWVLFDTHLVNRSTLDWCTLSAFAQTGRVLVCYGPAGQTGSVSINGSALELAPPSGQTPLIVEHEGIVIVVCSEPMIDATIVGPQGVYVGAQALDAAGDPVPHPSFKTRWHITPDGESSKSSSGNNNNAPSARAPSLTGWARAACDTHLSGEHTRFKLLKAPASLTALNNPTGYGWYRLTFKGKGASRTNSTLIHAPDRAHLFADSKRFALLGQGPGGSDIITPIPARKAGDSIVALIDDMGRVGGAAPCGEPKGLHAHIWSVTQLKAGKPKLALGPNFTPLVARTPIMGLRAPDSASPHRVTWSFTRRKKSPLWVRVAQPVGPAVLSVNDAPVELLEWWGPGLVLIPDDALKSGKNLIQIAPIEGMTDPEDALKILSSSVSFYEGADNISDKCDWAFAPWEHPSDNDWERIPKPPASQKSNVPTWWRCAFKAKPAGPSLFLDASGLTKGQLFLNGHNLARYWVSTHDGKPVPTQRLYHLPQPWLSDSGENSLVIFDEHGASPAKARIILEK